MSSITAPTRVDLRGEVRAAREPFRLLGALPGLLKDSSATSRVVITVPGFKAGDGSMAPLRSYLRRIGHRPEGWGLGTNHGDVEGLWPQVTDRVRRRADHEGSPVFLVGWSLGGVLAREAARDLPDLVAGVATFGTPVVGGPRYTTAADAYANSIPRIERLIEERERSPIRPPVTAIYSKNDGIVAWEACIDPFDNDVQHVEVTSAHLGMILDPDVWRAVRTAVAG